MISHDVEAMQTLCSRVLVLDDGHITESGTMDQLLSEPREAWTRAFAESYHRLREREWKWQTLQGSVQEGETADNGAIGV